MRKKFLNTLLILIIAIASVLGGVIYARLAEKHRYEKYPVLYSDAINSSAQEYGIKRELLQTVICLESGFDASFEDSDGKTGIYPLDEEEYTALAQTAGESTDPRLRYAPEVSIRMGALQLSELMSRYGDRKAVFCAICIGERETDILLAGSDELDTALCDNKTRNYIENAEKTYEKYCQLYQDTDSGAQKE